jgi:hypothetical protein
MAREMNIAISTLRTYIKNVFAKLGVHSRLEAAACASRAELPDEIPAGPCHRSTSRILGSMIWSGISCPYDKAAPPCGMRHLALPW